MDKDVLTKAKIVNYLNENIGLSKRECQFFFESFIDIIYSQLKLQKDVKIINFGIFKVKNKKPRIGRNPKTKQEVMISERNVVKFKPSNFLISLINSNINDNDEI
ncbi:MAG: integration host factor subunit alpha [Rickettsiales bacterium]|nr:integration host factor subunit alpha [Rickettsiales bacterium]